MSTIKIDSPISVERERELATVKRRLARERQRRVVSEIPENLQLLDTIIARHGNGRELATALAAEGFGSIKEVRQAAFQLGGRSA